MSTQNIQNTPNLTNKAKTYISLAFSNIIFMFIFYLISTPNNNLINAPDKDNCNFTYSVNKTDYIYNESDSHNYTIVYCSCSNAINGMMTFRNSYNITGIICMFVIMLLCCRINSRYFIGINIVLLILYYLMNLLLSNIILYQLGGFSSFCYIGLLNTSYFLLINFVVNYWIVLISIIVLFGYGFLIALKWLNCNILVNQVSRHNHQTNYQNNNRQEDVLPLYQERDNNLPTYQETMNIKYTSVSNYQ